MQDAWEYEAFAAYLSLAEQTGMFGEADETLFIQLLRKPAGGRRPIALFSSPYRVWGKTRKRHLQTWEGLMLMDDMYNTGNG